MTFINYQIKDNCYGQLLVGISAVATTITLKSGNGANFPVINPSTPGAILTLIQVDGSGDVVKSEQVKVTNRAADTLTVTRGFAGTVAQSFDADDYIYLYVVASVTNDMKDEIVRLNNDKIDTTDFNQSLRDDLTPNSIIYVDSTGAESVVVLGADGTYLKSNGTTVAPEFDTPPLDINSQNTDNGLLASDDYIVYYDTSENAVNKRLAKASEGYEGLASRASNTEADAGTNEEKFVTPYQLERYPGTIVAGSTMTAAVKNATAPVGGTTYTRAWGGTVARSGVYKVDFSLYADGGAQAYGRIFKNGVALGTERTTSSTTPINYSEDLNFTAGDEFELRLKTSGIGAAISNGVSVKYDLNVGTIFNLT